MDIIEFAETFAAVDFEQLISDSIEQNDDALIDALHEQLQHGQDQAGAKIGYYSTQEYAKIKFQMNSKAGFGVIDLKMEGDFYSGMRLEAYKDYFQIRSEDSKNDRLTREYGVEIWGLQDSALGEVSQDYVYEEFMGSLRESLNV